VQHLAIAFVPCRFLVFLSLLGSSPTPGNPSQEPCAFGSFVCILLHPSYPYLEVGGFVTIHRAAVAAAGRREVVPIHREPR
jgi:hypothetical protein